MTQAVALGQNWPRGMTAQGQGVGEIRDDTTPEIAERSRHPLTAHAAPARAFLRRSALF